ncbi:MAG: zinc ribbon domain-containing protein [Planctomycetota bacterium]
MINVQCPSCKRLHHVPDLLAGKKVECKDCGAAFVAKPADPPAASQTPPGPASPAPAGPGAPAAPPAAAQLRRRGPGPKVWRIAGGIVLVAAILACVFIFAILPALRGGLPGWTKAYIPEGAIGIAYINFDKIYDVVRETKTFKKFEKQIDPIVSETNLKLKLDEIEEIFLAFPKGGEPWIVVRTKEDHDLKEVIRSGDEPAGKAGGKEFVKTKGRNYVAKTEKRTFCFADSKRTMTKALEHLAKDEAAELDEKIRKGLKRVDGEDAFVVIAGGGQVPLPDEIDVMAFGLSAGGSIKVKAIVLVDEDKAEKKQIELAKRMIDVFKKVEFDYKGNEFSLTGSWGTALIDNLIKDVLEYREKQRREVERMYRRTHGPAYAPYQTRPRRPDVVPFPR